MSSSIKPIKIYGKHGPNPPKVRMIAEELSLPYDLEDIQFSDVKKPDFLKINPNGRMPAIYDPNNDFTLWESGPILEYITEKYDTENKISFAQGSKEYYLAKQWLAFQISGQGPYYGQAVWFTKFHSEKIESVQQRYYNEVKRVTSVLEDHLSKQPKGQDGPWMVGGKFSYVDLAFAPWQHYAATMLSSQVDLTEFKNVAEWLEKLKNRPATKKVLEDQ